jgi:hypothetical protein
MLLANVIKSLNAFVVVIVVIVVVEFHEPGNRKPKGYLPCVISPICKPRSANFDSGRSAIFVLTDALNDMQPR